ncbi:MAG: hypothetical protein V4642_09425 [Bacteroidota bacterium]
MKLEKESKEIDILIKSEPWSEQDLADFRKIMNEQKSKQKVKPNDRKPQSLSAKKTA